MWSLIAPAALLAASASAQITAVGPNGPTNPDKPEFYPIGAQVNQTSMSRLITLNSVDDFCIYGPPEEGPESLIGNVEPIVVAYCTKPRNGARLIPDGAIHSAHFIKTPLYVQVHGFWDGTKVNIPQGDTGGELDPHGAENKGNPVGGNVTSNVGGTDVFYEEWMSFVGFDQFCLRVCTAETANVTTALQCEHELDIMGCKFVMAIEDFYKTNGTFTSCEGEPAAPPGLYPLPNGSVSTFRQRYTGTWTDSAKKETHVYTVGQLVTPSAPAFWPKISNCHTYSSISNGVNLANLMVTAAPTLIKGDTSAEVTGLSTTSMSTVTTPTKIPTSAASPSETDSSGSKDSSAGTADGTNTQGSKPSDKAPASGAIAASAGLFTVLGGALVGMLSVF